MIFGIDHYAISVSNADKSIEFYNVFGFETIKDYTNPEGDLRIVQMIKDGMIIEFFQYDNPSKLPEFVKRLDTDLKVIGAKHIGINTDDLEKAAEYLLNKGVISEKPAINNGRLGRNYFFIKDPDGIFVEIIANA